MEPLVRKSPHGQAGNYHYLHWSGDQILYSTTSYPSDMVEDVKLGGLADLFPGDSAGMLQIWDRDFTGVAVANRNSSGQGNTSLWAYGADCSSTIAMPATASAAYIGPSAGDSSSCSTRGPLVQARTDGYFNGMYFVNGVRSYYSGAGSWTSPDALGGSSPFAYANNNPMIYEDPTGYFRMVNDPYCTKTPCNGIHIPDMGLGGFYMECRTPQCNADLFGDVTGCDSTDDLKGTPLPPGFSWNEIYRDAVKHPADPVAFWKALGPNGYFDLQTHGRQYIPAGNVAVGVWGGGARFPQALMNAATTAVLAAHQVKNPATYQKDMNWSTSGNKWQFNHCRDMLFIPKWPIH